jgi:hypothetical protein
VTSHMEVLSEPVPPQSITFFAIGEVAVETVL